MITEPIVGDALMPIHDFEVCLAHDRSIVNHLHAALDDLELNAFAFFDLELSTTERDALSHIVITQHQNVDLLDSEIVLLQDFAEHFVTMYALANDDAALAPIISSLIVRLTRAIISEDERESFEVTLRTHTPDESYQSDWHVDKTIEEIVGKVNVLDEVSNDCTTHIRPVFIIPLYGPSTLFYHTDSDLRTAWNCASDILTYTFGGLPVQHLIGNQSHIVSSNPEYGSVHKAGYAAGAIHTRPRADNGRLLLVITPGDFDAVLALQGLRPR